MKIALVVEYFDPLRGGAEQFTAWLARTLTHAGHNVHVVCYAAEGRAGTAAHERQVATSGLHVHALGGPRLHTAVGFRIFGWRAARWCRRIQPDVVHSMTVALAGNVYQPHAGVYAAMRAQARARRRWIGGAWKWHTFRFWGKQRTLLALEAYALRPHDRGGPVHILSLSPMMTDHFARHYPSAVGRNGRIIELPDPQIKPPPAPHAASTQALRAAFRDGHRLAPDDRVAVFVGHDFRRKGLRQALAAIARTRRWKLLVVGQGRTSEYRHYARSLGIGGGDAGAGQGAAPRVHFVGPTRQIEAVYAASDALLLPTFYDSFGLVAIEALARGLPVISTEFLGAAYLVREHHAGAIVRAPEETAALAAALEALPEPGDPAHALLAARARVAGASMPPERYLDLVLAVYRQVQHTQRQGTPLHAALPPADAPARPAEPLQEPPCQLACEDA
jgi:UDP-glucose:(heptosyl)LPS alpha-1,3-glucosyltransferase